MTNEALIGFGKRNRPEKEEKEWRRGSTFRSAKFFAQIKKRKSKLGKTDIHATTKTKITPINMPSTEEKPIPHKQPKFSLVGCL